MPDAPAPRARRVRRRRHRDHPAAVPRRSSRNPDIAERRLRHPLAREHSCETGGIERRVPSRQARWQAMHGVARRLVIEITPEVLLQAYACGIFPMAESADDPALFWIEPQRARHPAARRLPRPAPARAHASGRAASRSASTATSRRVIDGCAAPRAGRRTTWINAPHPRALPRAVRRSATATPSRPGATASSSAASTACALGGAFFGESMFSRRARRLEGRARPSRGAASSRRLPAARHAVRHRASRPVRRRRAAPARL